MVHELGEHDVLLADRPRRAHAEALELDRRIEHRRVAREVAAHPPRGRQRVRDVAVHLLGGDPVPLAPPLEHGPEGGAPERSALAQRLLPRVPRVAERVVAVADVDGVLVDDHPVRPRARARDDEVVAAQVERLHRVRVERQQRPERAGGRPQPLQERRRDPAMTEATLGTRLVVDGGEKVGLGIEVADHGEDPLRAAYVEQEVVDERDPAVLHARGTLPGG